MQVLDAITHKTKWQVREAIAELFPRRDVPTVERVATSSRVEPLSPNTYSVQLTMTKAGFEMLQQAKQLMSHRVPNGSTVRVIEAALEVLVEKLERERLGKTTRPQKTRRPCKKGTIARATRREVFARDGFQSTYVDGQGRRCSCRTMLELDHIDPRARGGSDEAWNLRVRCRAHNRLWAEDVFGKEHVARAIENRRQ